MEAILLAGGLGTRLRTVVSDRPKPLAPVGGRPFLTYLLDYWIDQGVNRFVLAVGYLHEGVRSALGDRYRSTVLDYSVEETPLGTGGALRLAAERIDAGSPFLALNGDTYFEVSLSKLCERHDNRAADLTVGLRRVTENTRYSGVELGEQARVLGIRARTGAGGKLLINGGVYLFRDRCLLGDPGCSPDTARSPVSFEDVILPALIASGKRVFGFSSDGVFLDIGVPDDYARAEGVLNGR